eukprot:TRINITY_DN6873_c0_g1_i1.p1 TRINITY_DN6873_c0_g1~~TRINITY_DN6873_c0_g1_i1.p1  ORF type:complete len:314 (+),score=74.59 TRINITY_DN6873_c0_g1_i1:48-989(+)
MAMKTPFPYFTRDLTRRFVELREKCRSLQGYEAGRGRDTGGHVIEMSTLSDRAALAPLWVEYVKNIEDDLDGLQQAIKRLQELHEKHLRITFEDQADQEQEIDIRTREITDRIFVTQKKIKNLGAAKSAEVKETTSKPEEIAMRKNIQKKLAIELQETSQNFKNVQQSYLLKLQDLNSGSKDTLLESQKAKTGPRQEEGINLVRRGFNERQLVMVENQDQLVEERHREIEKLARSINELAQIFQDLAVLVVEQGTILDRIDYNIEQVVVSVEKAVVELEKAEDHQKSSKTKLCILLLIVLIIIFTIVLVLRKM